MVVLTIDATSNGETVYFEFPIPNPQFVRLLSCSLFNTWHNLKNKGEVFCKDGDQTVSHEFPLGLYNFDNLMENFKSAFTTKNVEKPLSKILQIYPNQVTVQSFTILLDIPNNY